MSLTPTLTPTTADLRARLAEAGVGDFLLDLVVAPPTPLAADARLALARLPDLPDALFDVMVATGTADELAALATRGHPQTPLTAAQQRAIAERIAQRPYPPPPSPETPLISAALTLLDARPLVPAVARVLFDWADLDTAAGARELFVSAFLRNRALPLDLLGRLATARGLERWLRDDAVRQLTRAGAARWRTLEPAHFQQLLMSRDPEVRQCALTRGVPLRTPEADAPHGTSRRRQGRPPTV